MGSKTYNWLWFWVAEQKNKDIFLWGEKNYYMSCCFSLLDSGNLAQTKLLLVVRSMLLKNKKFPLNLQFLKSYKFDSPYTLLNQHMQLLNQTQEKKSKIKQDSLGKKYIYIYTNNKILFLLKKENEDFLYLTLAAS